MRRDHGKGWTFGIVPPAVLKTLRVLAMLSSAVMVLLFVVTAVDRLHYPFTLEWVEDGNLQELARVVAHQPVYVAPSVRYVPYLYAPVFYFVSAVAAKRMGVTFAALRLVSLLSSLGVFAGLYGLVRVEFRRGRTGLLAGVVAVGLFACAYPVTGGFFDCGRVDMLALLFTVLALLAGRCGHPVLAAVLWTAAFQTKQGVLPVAVLALCFEWQRPRRIVLGLGTFAALAGGSVVWLNYRSGGWFGVYAFGLAKGFPLVPRSMVGFWPLTLLPAFGIAMLLALAALLLAPPQWRSRVTSFYALSGAGLVLFTWYIFSHQGASGNSLLPAFLYIALTAGVGLGRLLERVGGEGTQSAAEALVLTAVILQIGTHLYTPSQYQPTSEERAEVEAFESNMRKLPGDVLVMDHPDYATAAGHTQYANGEAAIAILLDRKGSHYAGLHAEYADLVHSGRLSGIALDAEPERDLRTKFWLPADFRDSYPVRVQFGKIGGHFMTPRPTILYMECASASVPDAETLFPGYFVDASRCARHE